MDLKEWVKHFLKYKDLMAQDILSFKDTSASELLVERKSEPQTILLIEDLSLDKVSSKLQENLMIVTLNKKSNISFTVNNWNVLIKNKKLAMVFVNLNSLNDDKWVLHPYTHDII